MSTSSKRVSSDGKVSWNNYEGSKESHDVQATQMNVKENGDHYFYNTQTGVQGVALSGYERSKK